MSSSQDLITVLKAELRRAGLTYADVARELGLAESSIKRMFAKGDMPLSRIDEVLAVLKMDFAELARELAAASPPRRALTLEQARAVAAAPRPLLAAICPLRQWPVCPLYTSDAADDPHCVDPGGRRIITKKKKTT